MEDTNLNEQSSSIVEDIEENVSQIPTFIDVKNLGEELAVEGRR